MKSLGLLALVACGRVGFDAVAPPGDGARPDGVRVDAGSEVCENAAGATVSCACTSDPCTKICVSGRCDLACDALADCTFTCAAAACDITCSGQSDCAFTCAAGGCMFKGTGQAGIMGSCSGGGCSGSCQPGADCACAGTGCTCSGGGCN